MATKALEGGDEAELRLTVEEDGLLQASTRAHAGFGTAAAAGWEEEEAKRVSRELCRPSQ